MYLTVTPNSALDRVYFIDAFIPGTRMVATKSVESVGGKGLDASVALRGLNLETLALGFVAGNNGHALVNLLDNYGIHHDLIWVEGETRLAMVIVEQSHHRHSHIMSGGILFQHPPKKNFSAASNALSTQSGGLSWQALCPKASPLTFMHD
ncbi:MAG: hypothetical protein ACPLUL_09645 [Thermanaerothrix sp.]|uniref:hypothetical protein n=1 Tax=Thermanaerothrix sp. TaxID=2972675 RepID=UPI003C7C8F52